MPANTPHKESPESDEQRRMANLEKMKGIDWGYISRELEESFDQAREYVLSRLEPTLGHQNDSSIPST